MVKRDNPKAPQNSVCFLFALMLFCPQVFNRPSILHCWSHGSGAQHVRNSSTTVILAGRLEVSEGPIKLTTWYYSAALALIQTQPTKHSLTEVLHGYGRR